VPCGPCDAVLSLAMSKRFPDEGLDFLMAALRLIHVAVLHEHGPQPRNSPQQRAAMCGLSRAARAQHSAHVHKCLLATESGWVHRSPQSFG
jgi:hypothetical protein